jgi:hypothetical protein
VEIIRLMERMFKLLTRIGSMARTEGYTISKVEVTIPSIKCEFVNLFFVSVPIPKIEGPTMTMTTQSQNQSPP